jgi:hypothetical protein
MGIDDPATWYFKEQLTAFAMVAEMRFGESYCLRYNPDDQQSPSTDFDSRFAGREKLVALYAMGARQADLLSEYVCLYRVLEAADGANGVTFIKQHLGGIQSRDFGYLGVAPVPLSGGKWTNAFAVYRRRAIREVARLRASGASDSGVAG